jgi:hypothetical protein
MPMMQPDMVGWVTEQASARLVTRWGPEPCRMSRVQAWVRLICGGRMARRSSMDSSTSAAPSSSASRVAPAWPSS